MTRRPGRLQNTTINDPLTLANNKQNTQNQLQHNGSNHSKVAYTKKKLDNLTGLSSPHPSTA